MNTHIKIMPQIVAERGAMDLLEYGMRHEKSCRVWERMAAKGALAFVRVRADLYAARLEKRIPLSQDSKRDQEMLAQILEEAQK